MRRACAVLAAISLLGAACSGDGVLVFGEESSTSVPATTSAPPTTTEAEEAVSGEVGPDGLLLDLGPLGSIDVPAGALPEGTELSAEPIDASLITVPPGTELVGQPIQVRTSEQPSEPVIVALPIPPGAPTDDLWLLHVSDDGASEIVGGSVDDGEFVTAVRSLSRLAALHGKVNDMLGMAGVAKIQMSFGGGEPEGPPAPNPLLAEQSLIVLGEMTEPGQRVVEILGPDEIGYQRTWHMQHEFRAVGFEARKPRFVEYTWNVYGESPSGQYDGDVARLSFMEPGRYLITVDAYDPATGASAYAAKRVFAVEGPTLALYTNWPQDYAYGDPPTVYFSFHGGEAPYTLDWAFGTATYQETFDEETELDGWAWTASPITEDTIVDALVTDGRGATASNRLLLPFDLGGPDALLTGPTEVAVGEQAFFTVETDEFPLRDLRFLAWPLAAIEADGASARIAWDEPGVGRVGVFLASDDHEGGVLPVAIDAIPIKITGDPEPVVLRVPDPPTSLTPDQEGVWEIRVKGGIVAPATGFRGYTVTVDFGDESEPVQVKIPADTAAKLTERHPIPYSYEEPGEYTVTITATSPDDASDTKTFPMTVADQIVLRGEFSYDAYLNTPVWRVSKNRIRLVIRGTEVEVTRLESDTDHTYVGFTIGGGNVEPDCTFNQVITLTGSDLTYDPATRTISGTVQGRRVRTDDVGSNCPFGGRDGEETDIDSEVLRWVIVDGETEVVPGLEIVDGTIDGWLLGFFTAEVVEHSGP
jgi:hypothetical protein